MDTPVTTALLMCGGQGTRLQTAVEKPLVEINGQPMIARVRQALAESCLETYYAVVSSQTPKTQAYCDKQGIPTIETSGDGYVADLQDAVDEVTPPVLTVGADLPLLAGEVIDRILQAYNGGSQTVVVPAAVKRQLGVSVDPATVQARTVPAGINIVGPESDDRTTTKHTDGTYMSYDVRLAVNVNRPVDHTIAETLQCD